MAYGTVKVDNVTFTYNAADATTTFSGFYASTTNNLTLSGTASAATFTGTTANFTNVNAQNISVTTALSGLAITGGTAGFTTVTGTTVTGTTANFASGVFTTQVSGLLITGPTVSATTGTFTSLTGTTTNGTTASFTTGNFTSLTGTTTTGTTANFASGVFTTQVSGLLITGPTVSATTGTFTSLTGTTTTGTTANFVSGVFSTQVSGVTITGTTVATTTGNFISLTGTTATITSGIIASGTAALPSLAILSDPNTGIYSPGADQLAISTSGSEKLIVKSDGKVGIGTSSPVTGLDIRSSSDVSDSTRYNLVVLDLSSSASGVGSGINFGYRINSAGNIISRAASIGVRKENATDGDYASALTFHTTANLSATTERMRIDSSGRVGIGITVPSERLTVNDSNASAAISVRTGGAALNAVMKFNADDANYAGIGLENTALVMRCSNSSTPTERARIDSSGRLLVGTSTARTNNSEISTIDGNIALVNDDAYSTSLTRQFTYYSSTASYGVQPTANIVFNTVGDATSAISFWTRSSTVDYAERARIDSSGRLLVGTTSSTGSVSNMAPVIAGLFQSFDDVGAFTNGVAQTLFTIPNTDATYIITLRRPTVGDAANYQAVSILSTNATVGGSVSAVLTALKTAGNVSISISGTNLQGTQTTGGSASLRWVVTRVG